MRKDNLIQPKIILRQKIAFIILGLFLCFILLEAGLRLGEFVFLSLQEHRNIVSLKQKGQYRIMCLGESTTAFGGNSSYPAQLEEVLNRRNIGIKFSVINLGIPGINTTFIVNRLEDNLSRYKPDMVITMMGAADGSEMLPYEDERTSKTCIFLKSLRTYKLTRLIWSHMITKLRKAGFCVPAGNNQTAKRLHQDSLKNKFKEMHKEQNFFQDEQSFKDALVLDPKDERAYNERAFIEGKPAEVEQAFKKALELNPDSDSVYIKLGKFYLVLGRFTEAEQAFKKALELNSDNDSAYTELGRFYLVRGRFAEAEQVLKKALKLNPKNERTYIELAWVYTRQRRLVETEQVLKKALRLNPKNEKTYIELGGIYLALGKFTEEEQALKKALELNPENERTHIELGGIYLEQGRLTEAEQMFKRVAESDLKYSAYGYGGLATVYCEMGNNELSRMCAEKANSLREQYYRPVTVNNYRKLKQAVLDKRKLRLVCVQYPVRSIAPLKKIFEAEEGVVFVDNEKIFKDAIKKEGYKKYFFDMCGGEFGHCTPKGNRLLAGNIANTILKEIFNK